MFSNLQNKIDLKRIKDDKIEIDSEFAFREDFDIVNQTIAYFEKKKHVVNNIIIKEEVTQYEDEDIFNYLEKTVDEEQRFIYNDEETLDSVKEVIPSDEEDKLEAINESYSVYHKTKGLLPQLMEEANNELKTELDQYRMVGQYDDMNEGDYDVEALFDKDVIDMAKKEHLDSIFTMNWLSKQLVDYRKAMNDSLKLGSEMQIDNGLRSLDVNDTEEIKNKIKDLNESVKFLKSRKNKIIGIGE